MVMMRKEGCFFIYDLPITYFVQIIDLALTKGDVYYIKTIP